MTTLPQGARARRDMLTTTAEAVARATRCVPRTSPLGGATFSQTLAFGFLANPHASLEALAHTAAPGGGSITPQALAQRCTAAAASCLEQGRKAASTQGMAAEPGARPLLARWPAVYLQESATMVWPAGLATVWHGCGGRTPSRTSAALTRQGRLALRPGGRAGLQLQDGRTAERPAVQPPRPPGALRRADLGYWRVDALHALDQQGRFWRSRLQPQTALYDTTGYRRALLALRAAQRAEPVDLPILRGEAHRLPVRLLAVLGPPDVAAPRRRQLREAARKKRRQVRARGLALAAWPVVVPHLPGARLTLREARVGGRVRWPIALLVKVGQRQGQGDEARSTQPWRLLCAVSAKLLAMLIHPWLFLVSGWAYPNRSLPKAAQTLQKQALHLASACAAVTRLGTAIRTVPRCVAAGCRMKRRKKRPTTYPLWRNATEP